MDGPEDLRLPVEVDQIAHAPARMVGGEADVLCGMPVLRGHDQTETLLQGVGQRDDLIAAGHCQCAAWQEIVLKVDQDQCVHLTNLRQSES